MRHHLQARRLVRAVAALLVLTIGVARAQVDPRAILIDVVRQLQTGTPNPAWYGLQTWQVIAQQTGGTGIYPQLVMLGPVHDIALNLQSPLPGGMVYQLTALHKNGTSNWVLGIGFLTHRIEYWEAQFNFTGQGVPGAGLPLSPSGNLGPNANPAPGPAPGFGGPNNPPPGGRTERPQRPGSDACARFPNLC